MFMYCMIRSQLLSHAIYLLASITELTETEPFHSEYLPKIQSFLERYSEGTQYKSSDKSSVATFATNVAHFSLPWTGPWDGRLMQD